MARGNQHTATDRRDPVLRSRLAGAPREGARGAATFVDLKLVIVAVVSKCFAAEDCCRRTSSGARFHRSLGIESR
jgi:hypothetical protein